MGVPPVPVDANRMALVLGACDGLVLAVSLVMALRHQESAIIHAALGAAGGELVGMFAALYLSTHPRRFWPAAGCGVATAVTCLLPALPWLFTSGTAAFGFSLAIAVILGGIICWLRVERGWLSVSITFGVLTAAAVLCYGASFL